MTAVSELGGSDARVGEPLGGAIRLMGHDLRNKLGVMRNSAYYLNMTVGRQSEKASKHVGILLEQIDVSRWLIGNLMDLTAPQLPTPTETDVNALITGVLSQGPVAGRVEIARMLAPALPAVRTDPEQMGRAIENIVAYQCATLGEKDSLRVISREHAGRVHVELVDSGPGLSEHEQAHLFDLEQTDGLSASRIGLAVARRLIELNHALLEVESRQGAGTRFSIIMPVD